MGLAIRVAAMPTPPAAEWMSTVSPAFASRRRASERFAGADVMVWRIRQSADGPALGG
jgi:hypothetical protein